LMHFFLLLLAVLERVVGRGVLAAEGEVCRQRSGQTSKEATTGAGRGDPPQQIIEPSGVHVVLPQWCADTGGIVGAA
jgi:hypothetical protein